MKHGFFGYGHLAKAIHKGLSATGKDNFVAYSRLHNSTDINYTNSLSEMIDSIDTLWLCIRPQDMSSCLDELSQFDLNHLSIISPVAGYTMASIEKIIGKQNHIVRIMPNIGVKYNQGLIAYIENKPGNGKIQELLGNIGYIIPIAEDQFDTFTGVFGSGPGFLLKILGIWHKKSIQLGMNHQNSMRALSVFLGGISAHISDNIEYSPQQLVDEIATKGGTTEAGLIVYDNLMISEHISLSIDAAIQHCHNLK